MDPFHQIGALPGQGVTGQLAQQLHRPGVLGIEPPALHHLHGDLADRQRRRRRAQHLEHQPGQFARLEPAVGPAHRSWKDRCRFELGCEQPQDLVNMQQIGPMLADPLLQIDDGARHLGPLAARSDAGRWGNRGSVAADKAYGRPSQRVA